MNTHIATWNQRLQADSDRYWWEVIPHDAMVHDPAASLAMAMGETYSSDAVPFITAVERAFGAFGADGQFVKGHHDRAKTYLRGFTKVGEAQTPGQHFLTVIEALRELAQLQPGWDLSVKDDYVYYCRTSVSAITNPARDLKQADGTA